MHVVVKNNIRLYGLSANQVEVLKDHLTFDNPAYEKAKRYSRYKNVRIPPNLYYYTKGKDSRGSYIEIPRGVDYHLLLNQFGAVEYDYVGSFVEYPKFRLELREVQKEALDAYTDSVLSTPTCILPKSLISLPTGKGKTILALKIAEVLQVRALVLVHKDDLVEGWKKDIDLVFGGKVKPGIIKAKKREVGKYVTIATVQTLSRMTPEELSKYTDKFGLVIQDECHHVGLNIFNIIDKFNSKYKLGLSATPKRSDGLDFVFELFFGGTCYEYHAGRDDEDISNVDVQVLDSPFRYEPFVYKGEVFNYYDFDPKELPKDLVFQKDIPYKERQPISFHTIDNVAVTSSMTRVMVCKKILEHYREGHSCIVLFSQKEHIDMYYKYLRIYMPEDKIMKYYGDSKEDSDTMMRKAESREVLVTLATYAKATEGTNVKSWEVQFLVSSLKNEKNVEQATGRVRRRKGGKLDPVVIYDVRYSNCYSLKNHYSVRQKVYEELEYTVHDHKVKEIKGRKSVFSRGYSH